MNTVYEALRTLLRNKELEIKKLEKEIEALRIVLPIVAESGDSVDPNTVPSFDAPRSTMESPKPKNPITASDFENALAQVRTAPVPSAPAAPPRAPVTETVSPKPRTSWP